MNKEFLKTLNRFELYGLKRSILEDLRQVNEELNLIEEREEKEQEQLGKGR